MSSLRLIGKAFVLASRARIRFIAFCIVYSVVIALCAYGISAVIPPLMQGVDPADLGLQIVFMLVIIGSSVIISIFYAYIIINYRKIEIATLKCIGWKNNHIRLLIIGEILSVTLLGFIFVLEGVFHLTAILAYIADTVITYIEPAMFTDAAHVLGELIKIDLLSIVITFGIILGVQIAGVLVANQKILKVRPIQALQMKN